MDKSEKAFNDWWLRHEAEIKALFTDAFCDGAQYALDAIESTKENNQNERTQP
jgi:hypothetical protein